MPVVRREGEFDSDFIGGAPPRGKRRTRHAKKMERFGPQTEGPRFEHVPLRAEVFVSAPVFPTEDRARVEAALRSLFPDVRFEAGGPGSVVGRAEGLGRMAEVIRSTRIRDAAREALKGAIGADGAIRVSLNKQAAAAGHVNFALPGREVLGSVSVEIRTPRPSALVEELTWIDGESDERLLGTKRGAAARRSGHAGSSPQARR